VQGSTVAVRLAIGPPRGHNSPARNPLPPWDELQDAGIDKAAAPLCTNWTSASRGQRRAPPVCGAAGVHGPARQGRGGRRRRGCAIANVAPTDCKSGLEGALKRMCQCHGVTRQRPTSPQAAGCARSPLPRLLLGARPPPHTKLKCRWHHTSKGAMRRWRSDPNPQADWRLLSWASAPACAPTCSDGGNGRRRRQHHSRELSHV